MCVAVLYLPFMLSQLYGRQYKTGIIYIKYGNIRVYRPWPLKLSPAYLVERSGYAGEAKKTSV